MRERTSVDRMKSRDFFLDIVSFTGTVALAAWQRWEARDLIWGLWISSLIIGYSFIVCSALSTYWRQSSPRSRGKASPLSPFRRKPAIFLAYVPVVLFMLGFFTLHFGGFHFVHGLFLNGFFPLVPGTPFGESIGGTFLFFLAIVGESARAYWPIVGLSALSRLDDFRKAFATPGGPNMMLPYANVLRMHVMIFVFAGLHAAGLPGAAVYPILVFYFFPAGSLAKTFFARRTARGPSRASG